MTATNKQEMQAMKQRSLFIVMAVSMTWQLALAVIVPVVGGYYLDEHFRSAPLWTVAGAVLALLLVIGVMINTVKIANKQTNSKVDHK